MARTHGIGGTAYLKVNGKQYMLKGSIVVSIAPKEREGMAGMDGVHGFIEKPRVPFISGDFSVTGDTDMNEIEAMTDGTVTVELNNGKTAVLTNAWFSGPTDVDGAEGKVSLKWEGKSGYWM